MPLAFERDTPRDRFGGAVMAEEPDAEGYVAVRIRQSDALAIIEMIDIGARAEARERSLLAGFDAINQKVHAIRQVIRRGTLLSA